MYTTANPASDFCRFVPRKQRSFKSLLDFLNKRWQDVTTMWLSDSNLTMKVVKKIGKKFLRNPNDFDLPAVQELIDSFPHPSWKKNKVYKLLASFQ